MGPTINRKRGKRSHAHGSVQLIDMNHHDLYRLAREFRSAIEQSDPEAFSFWPFFITRFPKGACGNATILLGEYLKENGCGQFQYRSGERGDWTHAWLELKGTIIDITADQFDDQTEPVMVTKDRTWHDTFKQTDKPHPARISKYDSGYQQIARLAYEAIVKNIKPQTR